MNVEDVKGKQLVTIPSVAMLPEAAQTLRRENIGVLPVEDHDKLVGLVTLEDLADAGNDEDSVRAMREFHHLTKHA